MNAHHLEFRSHGGRTALWNETLLFTRCDALVPGKLFKITGDPASDLRFVPKGAENSDAPRHKSRIRD